MSDNDTDYASMKVTELKKELKSRGLSTTGNKTELVERLQLTGLTHDDDVDIDQTEVDAVEDLLQEEEEDVQCLSENSFLDELKIGEVSKVKNIRIEGSHDKIKSSLPDEQLLSLNQTLVKKDKSLDKNVTEETKARMEEDSTKMVQSVETAATKTKVVSVSKLGDDERNKQMRAERFGVVDKLSARAQRFGLPASNEDKLLQRKRRFETADATVASLRQTEDEERIKRRIERFGKVDPNEKTPISKVKLNLGVNSVVLDEKLKKREERFGTALA